jgi:DNA-binding response OmpR family regulator
MLRTRFELAGFQVVEACDGEEAVRMAQDEAPDLIVLDVMMPKLDGVEVCNRLRASFTTRSIPVIMLTARADRDGKLKGLTKGANDYVTKPFEWDELHQRVRNTLDWSSQQRSASPLTGLPGNHSINEEIRRRLADGVSFAAAADRRGSLQGVQRLLRLRSRRRGHPAARAHPLGVRVPLQRPDRVRGPHRRG